MTLRFLCKEIPFTIPVKAGSLILGGDAPQRGGPRKERREVCFGGHGLVAMPLRAPMLNRGLRDRRLELVPLHWSMSLKQH